MATKKRHIPQKGDRVAVTGRKGAYVVYLVDESLQVADLKQIGSSDIRLATIRWDTLTFLDEEDATAIPTVQPSAARKARRMPKIPKA
jgi:hypothetical protein